MAFKAVYIGDKAIVNTGKRLSYLEARKEGKLISLSFLNKCLSDKVACSVRVTPIKQPPYNTLVEFTYPDEQAPIHLPRCTKAAYLLGNDGKMAIAVLPEADLVGQHPYFNLALPALVRELVVTPPKEVFEKGKDVVDQKTGWVFPANSMPEEAFSGKSILIVDPLNFGKNKKEQVVVEASMESVAVVNYGFSMNYDSRQSTYSCMYEFNRDGTLALLPIPKPISDKEEFLILDPGAVRPIVMGFGSNKIIGTDLLPSWKFGVNIEMRQDVSVLNGFNLTSLIDALDKGLNHQQK